MTEPGPGITPPMNADLAGRAGIAVADPPATEAGGAPPSADQPLPDASGEPGPGGGGGGDRDRGERAPTPADREARARAAKAREEANLARIARETAELNLKIARDNARREAGLADARARLEQEKLRIEAATANAGVATATTGEAASAPAAGTSGTPAETGAQATGAGDGSVPEGDNPDERRRQALRVEVERLLAAPISEEVIGRMRNEFGEEFANQLIQVQQEYDQNRDPDQRSLMVDEVADRMRELRRMLTGGESDDPDIKTLNNPDAPEEAKQQARKNLLGRLREYAKKHKITTAMVLVIADFLMTGGVFTASALAVAVVPLQAKFSGSTGQQR